MIELPTDLLTALEETKVEKATIIPCDDRCMFAKGDDCDCECQGRNHKQGHKLTSVQMYVPRTDAGRAIKTLARNTPDWKRAVKWLKLRDEEGLTQKEIAEAAGVDAATVRRAIRSLTWTLALSAAQEETH